MRLAKRASSRSDGSKPFGPAWSDAPSPRPRYAAHNLSIGQQRDVARVILVYLVVLVAAAVFLVPFLWVVSASLMSPSEIVAIPPRWLPSRPIWQNYLVGWQQLPFTLFFRNTILITGVATAGTLLSSSIVAFGFGRLRGIGRDFLFLLLISTMLLPSEVTFIPLFILFNHLRWVDTFLPLTVPYWFGTPFYIFLLRQFIMTIPRELDDAAKIDGCSTFGIYWRIVMPLCGPALATVAIFSVVANWNDFLGPLIYLNNIDLYTIALGLQMFKGSYLNEIGPLMAMTIVATVPVLLLFGFTQRYFVAGVTLTGIKG